MGNELNFSFEFFFRLQISDATMASTNDVTRVQSYKRNKVSKKYVHPYSLMLFMSKQKKPVKFNVMHR